MKFLAAVALTAMLAVGGSAPGHGNNPLEDLGSHGSNPSPPASELQRALEIIESALALTTPPHRFTIAYPPWCSMDPCAAGEHEFNLCYGHAWPWDCEDCDECAFWGGHHCMDRRAECDWTSAETMDCLHCVRLAQGQCRDEHCHDGE